MDYQNYKIEFEEKLRKFCWFKTYKLIEYEKTLPEIEKLKKENDNNKYCRKNLIFNEEISDSEVLLCGWRDEWFDFQWGDKRFLGDVVWMKRWMIFGECCLDEEMVDFMILYFGWRDWWFCWNVFGWRDGWFCGIKT